MRRRVRIGARLAACLGAWALGGAAPAAASDPEEALRAQVERYVRERAPYRPTAVEVPPLAAFDVAWTAPGDVRVVLSSGPQRFLGSVPITISVLVDGVEAKRGVVTARVSAERPVFLVGRDLDRGAMVHPGDVRREVRDVAGLPPGAILDRDAIVGMRTTRALSAGHVFLESHLRRPQLVMRGQMVRLHFREGALRIQGVGKARQDGRPGETIRVLNVQSRREIVGTVTESGEVDVAL
jgi:flagella basal body P-ring formation protein FlgA